MPFVNNGKHVMLSALGLVAVKASLHTGVPGTDGSNEVSGGSPVYARKTIAWNAPAGGEMTKNPSPAVVFDVPGSTSVKYVGFWDNGGATFYGAELVTQEDFGAQGTYTLLDTSKLKIGDPA